MNPEPRPVTNNLAASRLFNVPSSTVLASRIGCSPRFNTLRTSVGVSDRLGVARAPPAGEDVSETA
jgi:hypothetical protein